MEVFQTLLSCDFIFFLFPLSVTNRIYCTLNTGGIATWQHLKMRNFLQTESPAQLSPFFRDKPCLDSTWSTWALWWLGGEDELRSSRSFSPMFPKPCTQCVSQERSRGFRGFWVMRRVPLAPQSYQTRVHFSLISPCSCPQIPKESTSHILCKQGEGPEKAQDQSLDIIT